MKKTPKTSKAEVKLRPKTGFLHSAEFAALKQRARARLLPLIIIWSDMQRADLPKQASAMAYITLFSLVPSLAAVFTVISLFTPVLGENSTLMQTVREFILRNLAAGSGTQVIDMLQSFMSKLDIKAIGISSFAGLIVTLILLLRQIEEALNAIWLVRKARNIFTRFMYFWTFLTLGIFIASIAIGLASGFDLNKMFTSISSQAEFVVKKDSFLRIFAGEVGTWSIGFIFFFLLYKVVPNCRVAIREALWGALFSATAFHLAGKIYGIYASNFTNYKSLYGALAALPIFLLWLYICWLIILLGALLAWRIQQGLPREDKDKSLAAAQTAIERLRNNHVQASLPKILLTLIYREFDSASGKGLTLNDLTHKLKLPESWIADAADVLLQMGYIVEAEKVPMSRIETALEQAQTTYFPTRPGSAVELVTFMQELKRPMNEWVEQWKYDFPVDLKQVLARESGNV